MNWFVLKMWFWGTLDKIFGTRRNFWIALNWVLSIIVALVIYEQWR